MNETLLVAKSYAGWVAVGAVYEKNKKQYVEVQNPKTGIPKTVRVYTETEYKRLYPEAKITKPVCNQRKILGFKEPGYITVVKGKTIPHEKWLFEHGATYTRFWGWSFACDVPVPQDLPEGLTTFELDWIMVGRDTGELKNEVEITKLMKTMYGVVPTCLL